MARLAPAGALLLLVTAAPVLSGGIAELVPSRHIPGGVPVSILAPPSYGGVAKASPAGEAGSPSVSGFAAVAKASPAGEERRYPAIYFLHDGRGDERVLERRGVAEALHGAMRAGRLPEALLISPRGGGSWFVDSHDGRLPYGRFLTEELVPFVDGRYRTLAARSARGAAGISMGGYGALRLGFTRGDLFGAVGALSPAVQRLTWRTLQSMPFFVRPSLRRAFGPSEADNSLRQNDLYDLLLSRPELSATAPRILVRCGESDSYRLADVTRFFDRFLSALGIPREVVVEPGGHDWDCWQRAAPPLFAGLLSALAGPGEV